MLSTALAAVLMAFGLGSCERYDLDERLPEDLGPSIYDFLKENGFTTYVRLIDEPGLYGEESYHNVLSRTGSKTLFVADEEAVKRFYASGKFKKADGSNVKCYEDLSLSQKKMMLYGAMLDAVYQAASLSNREDENGGTPITGDCLRRVSQLDEIYDSVPVIMPQDMPDNPYWSYLKNQGEGIRCMTDATKRPRIMITPKFLQVHQMEASDYEFLFHHNDGVKRADNEVSVNGIRMIGPDNKCLNGFVHVMEDVIIPLPNMAEMIKTLDNTKVFNSLLWRFSAPYIEFPLDGDDFGETHTENFNKIYGTDIDQIYQSRFISARSQPTPSVADGDSLYWTSMMSSRKNVKDNILKYDPGWNSYFPLKGSIDANLALQKDMGVMIVPNDSAMEVWWNETPLKDRYGHHGSAHISGAENIIDDMKDVPDHVIRELINNGMLASLVGSVPSKFSDVLNDAQDPMGLKTTDITDVNICCNGAVYTSKKVFAPTSYRSVAFPTLVDSTLQVIDWAIENCHFKPYMNSMVSHYSFFIPKGQDVDMGSKIRNNCLVYISPIIESIAKKYSNLYVFYFDKESTKAVQAVKYAYDPDKEIKDMSIINSSVSATEIENVLTDMLNYHIVIGDAEDVNVLGKVSPFKYFRTKGGGMVRFEMVENIGDGALTTPRTVWGSYQQQLGTAGVSVTRVYDQRGTADGNGRSYIIPEPLYNASQTVAEVIENPDYDKFSTFAKLLSSTTLPSTGSGNFGGMNLSTFNTYNYTVYVPSNAKLDEMIANKSLLLAEDLTDLENYYKQFTDDQKADLGMRLSKLMRGAEDDGKDYTPEDSVYQIEDYLDQLQAEMDNFVKYHIQDNSLFIGGDFEANTNYETAYMQDKTFAKLRIESNGGNNIVIVENGNVHNVLTDPENKYYNIMCREYQYKDSNGAKIIETSSYAVIHLIDTPFEYCKISNAGKFGYGSAEQSLYFKLTPNN